ncbi:MAG TPA: lipid kinase [Woeseiaceae bacterium]|nr:lipid kinase [Woeseiaceae bacterium]
MSGPRRRALWIVNPKSRHGSSDLAEVRDLLEHRGFVLRDAAPEGAAAIAKCIEEHAGRVDFVVVGGGDGTLSSAAGALAAGRLTLGILPLGTANDLSRTLGLPTDLRAAAAVIADGYTRRIDVGVVNGVHFFNAADIGLGTRVAARLDRRTKRRWGALAYAHSLLGAWREHRAFSARIRCDGRDEQFRVIQLKIGNGKYYGGGMAVLEDAAIDDGRLDLIAVRPQGLIGMLSLAPALRGGSLRGNPRVKVRSAREIAVRTRRRMPVSTDGEITTATPAVFRVLPGAVTVCVPNCEGVH